jgi:hypothetical protein
VTFRLLSAVNGIFEHANIRVRPAVEPALSWLWVTPQMHKVHHSRDQAETDTNYGNLLALPDRLFGTFVPTTRALSVEVRLGRCRSGREPVVRRAARDAVAVGERAGSCSAAGRLNVRTGPKASPQLGGVKRWPPLEIRAGDFGRSSRSAARCCSAVCWIRAVGGTDPRGRWSGTGRVRLQERRGHERVVGRVLQSSRGGARSA